MPIYRNNKEVVSIYRNGKEVSEIHRDGHLVYSAGTPVESTFMSRTTANGLSVKDASKAKATSVKGNTWVRNQLVDLGRDSVLSSGFASYELNGRELKLVSTTSTYNSITFAFKAGVKYVSGHKVLILFDAKSDIDGYKLTNYNWRTEQSGAPYYGITPTLTTSYKKYGGIVSCTNTDGTWNSYQFRKQNGADERVVTYWIKDFMFIDLTLMFGAGNEPTTALEYARRRGYNSVEELPYEEYNAGEVVGVNHLCLPPARKVSVEQMFPKYDGNVPIVGSSGTSLTGTCDENGIITINGVCPYYCNFTKVQNEMMSRLIQGHTYILNVEILNNPDNIRLMFAAHNGRYTRLGEAPDYTKSYSYLCKCNNVSAGAGWGYAGTSGVSITFTDVKVRLKFYDLTDIFGEGNEPTSVDDFYRLCPWAKEYQPYGVQERYIGFGVEEKTHFVGKVIWNQICRPGLKSKVSHGVTLSFDDATGEFYAYGTRTEAGEIILGSIPLTAGHKILGWCGGYDQLEFRFQLYASGKPRADISSVVPINTADGHSAHLQVSYGKAVGDVVNVRFKPMLFDLTQMFGEGNEPATVEEFYLRCPFAKEYQPYNAGEERMIGQTSLLPISTANFPYGMHGLNGVQDEHTPKQDTRRFGMASLASLGWTKYTIRDSGVVVYYAKAYNGYTSNAQVNQIVVCGIYTTSTDNIPQDKQLSYRSLYIGGGACLMVRDDSISSVEELKAKFLETDKVVFALVDPIITPCDDQMAFEAYDQGVETVVGSDAPVTMNAKYKKK